MKTCVITGGNRGLGYECARALAREKDWTVVIACRDPRAGQAAVSRLHKLNANTNIAALKLDLASLASVNAFIASLQAGNLPPLGALVCNAGLQIVSGTKWTEDGFEMTFGVNHLGHYLLVHRLLESLIPPARILFVSSGTHDPALKTSMPAPEYRDARSLAFPNEIGGGDPEQIGGKRYTTSKLANIFTTYELARRLEARGIQGITVNAFDPGMMPGTGLARDHPLPVRLAWNYILPLLTLLRRSARPVEVSGAALARLVSDPELANTTGKFFSGTDMVPSSAESYDRDKAKELWETSAELVGLAQPL